MKSKPNYLPIKFFILLLLIVVAFFSLQLRLLDLQLVRGQLFRDLADNNRFYSFLIPAHRGVFLDRYSDPLVWNIARYFEVDQPDALYSAKRPITKSEALMLMSTSSAKVKDEYLRYYRYPEVLAHILGFVGSVTQDDLKKDRLLPLQKKIGRSGLEAVYDDVLSGRDGQEVYEINALGERQKLVKQTPALSGKNILTTIDPYLSEVAFESLGEQKGSVVILDANSGQILTMVSSPSFNPNIFSNTFTSTDQEKQRRQSIAQIISDPSEPFFNRSIAGSYPPGSVFKIITALAGLENKKIDDSTIVKDEGVLKVGDYQYGNWYFRQYGRVEGEISLKRAIARSNDIFFYKVAEWVGPEKIAEMARLFGFGKKNDINLGYQTEGLVPDPAWKEKTTGERWFLGNTYHFGIGQGDLLVSPIQVAQMGQILANKGTYCQLKLVEEGSTCHEVGVSEENINKVLAGMLDACSDGGTAFPFFTYNRQYRSSPNGTDDLDRGAVACKTGTAEFGVANAQGHRKTHAWFLTILQPQIGEIKEESTSTVSYPDEIETLIANSNQKKDLQELRKQWAQSLKKVNFPNRIVIAVLVESDDKNEYKEGSADAGLVAKKIVDWLTAKDVSKM